MPQPAAADPVIQVRGLVAGYGERVVLNGVDLDVNAGEIMVIMGGSGSGKSTLLNHLLGLAQPRAGVVRVLGRDVNAVPAAELRALRRTMGVAFQGGALFSSMSVLDNILLPLQEHTDLDDPTMRIMAHLKMEVVSLSGTDDLMPAELSGGMVKRAALARAIVMDPKLLFCDEPSAGLDPVVSASIDQLILRLKAAMGMTIVVVTHELHSAMTIADRICILDQGAVLALGPVADIQANPSPRVQDLLHRRAPAPTVTPEQFLGRLTRGAG